MTDTYTHYAQHKDAIEGWFSDISAGLFDAFLTEQKRLVTSGPMLEIGVAYGRSALMLAEHLGPDETLELSELHKGRLDSAMASLGAIHPGKTLRPRFGKSDDIDFTEIPPRKYRFIHIDANHMRTHVLKDLALADHALSETGIVSLDDFLAPQYFSATFGAIEYLVRHPESFRFVLVGFNKAYLCRPSAHLYWLVFVRDRLPNHLRSCGLTDFTIWKTDQGDDFRGFGIAGRQFDKDFFTWRVFGEVFGLENREERGVAEEVDFDSI